MNIGVFVKLVPATSADIRVSPAGDRIELTGLETTIGPYDEFALEEGLKLKDKIPGSRIIAFTAGGDEGIKVLQHAFSLGVDEGWLLKGFNDPAAAGAAAAKAAGIEIAFCGRQAVDDDMASFHAALGEALGWPHVSSIVAFEISGDRKTATAKRRVEGGEETWEVRLPAVFSCDKGLNVPRLATLKGRMAARKMQPKVVGPAELGADAGTAGLKAVKFRTPPARGQGRILEGEKDQVVRELVRILREERKVI